MNGSDGEISAFYLRQNVFRKLVCLFSGSFLSGFHFIIAVFDDGFSGYDPDKRTLVINNRYKVLIDGAIQKIFHVGIGVHWFIGGTARDRHDRDTLGLLDIVDICAAHPPEKIALGDGAEIFAIHSQDGNTGVLTMLHFFEGLAECLIFEDIGNLAFGNQKKQNIHVITSFLHKYKQDSETFFTEAEDRLPLRHR